MEERKEYFIKWYLRIWYALPLFWICILSFIVIKDAPEFVYFPIPLFFTIFGFIYFNMTNKKITMYDEQMVIIKGIKKYSILFDKIIELDKDVKPWLKGSPLFLIIKYTTVRNKVKSVFIETHEFGNDNILSIVSFIIGKNKSLSRFKNRFY